MQIIEATFENLITTENTDIIELSLIISGLMNSPVS